MKNSIFISAAQIQSLFDYNGFDTNLCVDQLEGHETYRIYQDGRMEDAESGFEYSFSGDFSRAVELVFESLVAAACAPESDLPSEFIGLLLFAEKKASTEDVCNFINWLEGSTMWSKINVSVTSPGDHFECAEEKTWNDMENYYLANRPKHTEPHW